MLSTDHLSILQSSRIPAIIDPCLHLTMMMIVKVVTRVSSRHGHHHVRLLILFVHVRPTGSQKAISL